MAVQINFSLEPYLCNVLKALEDHTNTGQALADVCVIKMYPLDDLEINDLPLPAILVDLYEVEPDPDADIGTGQLGVQLMMQLWVVVAATAEKAPMTVRQLAMAAGAIIHDASTFGSPVSRSLVTDIIGQPRLQDKDRQQYLIWSVEWQHATVLSTAEMLCIDDPPVNADQIDEVYWSKPPDIGPKLNAEGEPIFSDEGQPEAKDAYKKTEYYRDDKGNLILDEVGEPIRVLYDSDNEIIPYERYKLLFGIG